jgi:hypothetical protein
MKIFKKIKIKEAITGHFWLKLWALLGAVGIWVYISSEITKGTKI